MCNIIMSLAFGDVHMINDDEWISSVLRFFIFYFFYFSSVNGCGCCNRQGQRLGTERRLVINSFDKFMLAVASG